MPGKRTTAISCVPVKPVPQCLSPADETPLVIEEGHAVQVLAACMTKSFFGRISPGDFADYRKRFLAAAGSPKDPIEVVLLDQLLCANQQISSMHIDAAIIECPEAVATLANSVACLMAECRKTSQAIWERQNVRMAK